MTAAPLQEKLQHHGRVSQDWVFPEEQQRRTDERQRQEKLWWPEAKDACDDQESRKERQLQGGTRKHRPKVNHLQY